MKIRNRLVATICIATSIAFMLLLLLLGSSLLNRLIQENMLMHTNDVNLAAASVDTVLDRAYSAAVNAASSSNLQDILAEEYLTPQDFIKNQFSLEYQLSSYLNFDDSIVSIFLVTDEVTYSNSIQYSSYDIKDEPWFSDFKNANMPIYLSSPYTTYNTRGRVFEEVFSLAIPVYSINNSKQQLGSVVVNVSVDDIKQLLPSESIYTNYTAIYSSDGELIVGVVNADGQQPKPTISEDDRWEITVVSNPTQYGWQVVSNLSLKQMIGTISQPILFSLVMLAIILIALVWVLLAVTNKLLAPMVALTDCANAIGRGDFNTKVSVDTRDEFHDLANAFNVMQLNLEKYVQQRIEHEKHIKDMEIERLMLQINPHFIYNTLDSIIFMSTISNQPNIAKFTKSFIALLHNTLSVSRNDSFITFEREKQNIENYIVLQQYRYPDKFSVEFEVEENAGGAYIPNIFALTLVENAIFHGVCPMEGKGKITISAEVDVDNKMLTVSVKDDGVGMPHSVAENLFSAPTDGDFIHKIGLRNIRDRIKQLYGDEYGLDITSDEVNGTSATIRIKYVTNLDELIN